MFVSNPPAPSSPLQKYKTQADLRTWRYYLQFPRLLIFIILVTTIIAHAIYLLVVVVSPSMSFSPAAYLNSNSIHSTPFVPDIHHKLHKPLAEEDVLRILQEKGIQWEEPKPTEVKTINTAKAFTSEKNAQKDEEKLKAEEEEIKRRQKEEYKQKLKRDREMAAQRMKEVTEQRMKEKEEGVARKI